MRPARRHVGGRVLTEFGAGWLDTVYAATYSPGDRKGEWTAHVPGRPCKTYASLRSAAGAVERTNTPRRPNR